MARPRPVSALTSIVRRKPPARRSRSAWRRRGLGAGTAGVLIAAALFVALSTGASTAAGSPGAGMGNEQLGIKPGKIKHVWFIILENKAYDATFTGLNNNTYLWQTLPSQGVLLKNYYGTGHSSLDNYISLVSGQAPQPDDQSDCPDYDKFAGSVELSGSLKTNPNYGQMVSAAGPNAAPGTNGCVYPASVPTLFNQFNEAGVSWKGYAQDLGNPDASGPSHDAGTQYCGAPDSSVGPTGSTEYPNPSSANATDQYVAKHFPFPWFESILNSGDCNEEHIANLFSPTDGLYHDLQSAATTPAFSWITPNNCSDGHDAVCHGNNLSGGFKKGTPLEEATEPEAPVNYTGGLYSADLFLEHVIPEIEESPAFKEGGLIDISFDEAYPPFTYSSDSFANSTVLPPNVNTSLEDDSAGETLDGFSLNWEPTGPNVPLEKAANGQELYPGPGFNEYLDRPSNCVAQTVPSQPAGTCLLGAAGHSPGARTDSGATAPEGSSTIDDNSISELDKGRTVSGTGIPAGAFVGEVTDTPVTATKPSQEGGIVDEGSFALVNSAGEPLTTTAAVSGITLGAETPSSDPLYSADGAATGGGDTGSVLISPYITPGSVSTRYYNHYSWLRTMEDLFNVKKASPGLDKKGHIGYAAQPGLAAFGPDVFNNPKGPRKEHP
jgi:hypothetical protein